MLTPIVAAFTSACTTLSKNFLFGTLSEDLNKPSMGQYDELVFLQSYSTGNIDAKLLKYGSGNIGFQMSLYVLEKYNEADKAITKQAKWDAALTTALAVINQACTVNRNVQRSIVNASPHTEILRFGSGNYIATRININFSNYWQC